MKFPNPLTLLVAAGCWSSAAFAQLEIVTNAEPQRVFSAGARKISVTFHNPGDQSFAGDIRTRLWQTTSATAVQSGEMSWKYLQVLPGQTVLESAQLDFPVVKAETKFLVQWLENTNHIIGRTEVLVYPTHLLAELKPLAGDEPLGVFDPQNRLKPLLAQLLYHKNPEICTMAARAGMETAGPDRNQFKGVSDEQQVNQVRQWWEEEGVKQRWGTPSF